MGGNGRLKVIGIETGGRGTFHAPGSRPTIDADTGDVITVADNSHLSGLDITGGGGNGNFVNANDGVDGGSDIFAVFTDLDVSRIGEKAFDFVGAGGVTAVFNDVRVSDVGGASAIDFGSAGGASVFFTNVRVSDVHDRGINFDSADGASVDFTHVQVLQTGGTGISFLRAENAVASFTDVQVSQTGDTGIDFFDAEGALASFIDVRVSDTASFGMDFEDADGLTATFDRVTFAGSIGSSGTDTDALIRSSGAPLPSLNGTIVNETDNVPPGDLCRGDFTGTLVFENGATTTITDGAGCAP
jgi:hypothetical protein